MKVPAYINVTIEYCIGEVDIKNLFEYKREVKKLWKLKEGSNKIFECGRTTEVDDSFVALHLMG